MTDDKKVSELISKSLRYRLSEEEKSQVQKSLEQNEEARKFAKLSQVIQESVCEAAELAEGGDTSVGPGLSDDAKNRLKLSVTDAVLRNSQATDAVIAKAGAEERAEGSARISGDSRTIIGTPFSSTGNAPKTRKASSTFQIVRKLGEGGLGTVWLAKDSKLKRNVAIKEMKLSALESPKAWFRFRREAEITGHLEHPGIVPLYQFGVDSKSQQPFYAMRFVGKRTLSDAIIEHHERLACEDHNHLRLHRLLGDFLRVCQAIAFAHSRGVIHRDLKPENIAIDSFGQVIVLDWGLAKVMATAELGMQLLLEDETLDDGMLAQTMAGEAIGTPLYMSPEQADGDLDAIDERTDIYGLGAILFSILTGHAPHEKTAQSAESGSRVAAVLKSIASGDTPTPSDAGACIPQVLENICLKAMAKKRYARFESAIELAEAVERWMAGQTDRAARYETLRMEGRELKNDFQAGVDDLESNVRFASLLPPVQELIAPENDEEDAVWRERLATIFTGLMRAKPAFSRIALNKIVDGQFTELVRVERHSRDRSTVRKVPRSKLRTGTANQFLMTTLNKHPEEVLCSLVCDPLCEKDERCDEPHLVAGLPIYDEQTEEPFGVLMIDCDLDSIFERQMKRSWTAVEIVAASDTFHTLMQAVDDKLIPDAQSIPVSKTQPDFVEAIEELQTNLEYIDETNQRIYGSRLWLVDKVHGLMYLLRLADDNG